MEIIDTFVPRFRREQIFVDFCDSEEEQEVIYKNDAKHCGKHFHQFIFQVSVLLLFNLIFDYMYAPPISRGRTWSPSCNTRAPLTSITKLRKYNANRMDLTYSYSRVLSLADRVPIRRLHKEQNLPPTISLRKQQVYVTIAHETCLSEY